MVTVLQPLSAPLVHEVTSQSCTRAGSPSDGDAPRCEVCAAQLPAAPADGGRGSLCKPCVAQVTDLCASGATPQVALDAVRAAHGLATAGLKPGVSPPPLAPLKPSTGQPSDSCVKHEDGSPPASADTRVAGLLWAVEQAAAADGSDKSGGDVASHARPAAADALRPLQLQDMRVWPEHLRCGEIAAVIANSSLPLSTRAALLDSLAALAEAAVELEALRRGAPWAPPRAAAAAVDSGDSHDRRLASQSPGRSSPRAADDGTTSANGQATATARPPTVSVAPPPTTMAVPTSLAPAKFSDLPAALAQSAAFNPLALQFLLSSASARTVKVEGADDGAAPFAAGSDAHAMALLERMARHLQHDAPGGGGGVNYQNLEALAPPAAVGFGGFQPGGPTAFEAALAQSIPHLQGVRPPPASAPRDAASALAAQFVSNFAANMGRPPQHVSWLEMQALAPQAPPPQRGALDAYDGASKRPRGTPERSIGDATDGAPTQPGDEQASPSAKRACMRPKGAAVAPRPPSPAADNAPTQSAQTEDEEDAAVRDGVGALMMMMADRAPPPCDGANTAAPHPPSGVSPKPATFELRAPPPTRALAEVAAKAEEALKLKRSPAASEKDRRPDRRSASSVCSSVYRGVSWHGPSKQWRASIFAKKPRHLGYFSSQEESACVYDLAAVQLRTAACAQKYLNFPENLELYAAKVAAGEGPLDMETLSLKSAPFKNPMKFLHSHDALAANALRSHKAPSKPANAHQNGSQAGKKAEAQPANRCDGKCLQQPNAARDTVCVECGANIDWLAHRKGVTWDNARALIYDRLRRDPERGGRRQ